MVTSTSYRRCHQFYLQQAEQQTVKRLRGGLNGSAANIMQFDGEIETLVFVFLSPTNPEPFFVFTPSKGVVVEIRPTTDDDTIKEHSSALELFLTRRR